MKNLIIKIIDLLLPFIFAFILVTKLSLIDWQFWGLIIIYIAQGSLSYFRGGQYVERLWNKFPKT